MNKNFFLLQFAFFLLSAPALFAKGIDIPAGMLIWWRSLFGSMIAFAILFFTKQTKVNRQQFKWLAISGVTMGLHWWTFFWSIQVSTVAIGILSLYTFPIISVLIEPFFFQSKISIKQVIGGIGIIVGVFFLIPEFSLSNSTTLGVCIGIASAVFYSVRNILTRKYLSDVPTPTTMGYHILFSFFTLSIPTLFVLDQLVVPSGGELGLILILASFFTFGSHGLYVYLLKKFTVSTLGILGGMQVVYGTLMAFFVFKEVPTINFYIGAVILLGIAVFESLPNKQLARNKSN